MVGRVGWWVGVVRAGVMGCLRSGWLPALADEDEFARARDTSCYNFCVDGGGCYLRSSFQLGRAISGFHVRQRYPSSDRTVFEELHGLGLCSLGRVRGLLGDLLARVSHRQWRKVLGRRDNASVVKLNLP